MAGLVVVAGMVLIDRHRQKKEARAQKLVYDDARYAQLQYETTERLIQSPSSSSTDSGPGQGHRRYVSNASTVDSLFNEKQAARLESSTERQRRRMKWWRPKSLGNRRRSIM